LDLTGYKLTFDDEFNSFSWAGAGGTWQTTFYFGGRTLSSNGELEYYSDPSVGVNPFSVQNGALEITAAPSTNLAATGGLPYTSGLITTESSFTQTYGYFEMRAKLPAGQGLWPAFWLLPADKSWPPEIDPLEAFGSEPNQIHYGAISTNSSQSGGDWVTVPTNITDSYHTYGVMWTPTTLTYYFDGQQVAQLATPSDMNKPMYMLADLAVGGSWGGAPFPDTQFPAHLDIDYIRAYSNDPNAVAVTPQPVSPPDAPQPTVAATAVTGPTQASQAATNSVAMGTTTGTSGNDYFNTQYGDTATRSGGAGDDWYVLTDPRMYVNEVAGQGTDTVLAWIDYTLPPNLENITNAATYGLKLYGNAQSNILTGNQYDDLLDGGAGDDVLTGGGGSNTFVIKAGSGYDTITDFKPGPTAGDVVRLDGYGLKDFAAIQAAMTPSGSDSVLHLDNGETLTFKGVAPSSFSLGDFQIVNPSIGAAPAPGPVIVTPDAQPTPVEPRISVDPGTGKTATGTTGADDIYATGNGQTLVGNGGDDIFHIGTYTNAKIVIGSSGITTVDTAAAKYTLPTGVNDLRLLGSAAHNANGNGGNNWIVGSDANDTINGGVGNDVIVVGSGANKLTGGTGQDMFVFAKTTDHDNVITDFVLGQDMLDLRPLTQSINYQGADPLHDHVISLAASGSGTAILIDPDGTGPGAAHTLVTVQNVAPTALKIDVDYVWH
jgi:beta-glucanase (GH16 family)